MLLLKAFILFDEFLTHFLLFLYAIYTFLYDIIPLLIILYNKAKKIVRPKGPLSILIIYKNYTTFYTFTKSNSITVLRLKVKWAITAAKYPFFSYT